MASALMAKMKMSAKDRPKVKAQCLRLLASLKLDPARSTLIGGFIDSYLTLTAQEMKQYERELADLPPTEREATMEIMTSWHREGIAEGLVKGRTEGLVKGRTEGITEGKETIVMRQLRRRFGSVSDDLTALVDTLSSEQFDNLAEALLDFKGIADLEKWLARH